MMYDASGDTQTSKLTNEQTGTLIPARLPLPRADVLLEKLRRFCFPWRPITIAVDGRNGAGKSSLARHLSWQLGMPAVETDMWLADTMPISHNIPGIEGVVRSRHDRGRPVLVEGVAVLRTLELVGVQPDFLVMVINLDLEDDDTEVAVEFPDCLSSEIQRYLDRYRPQDKADFILTWRETATSAVLEL